MSMNELQIGAGNMPETSKNADDFVKHPERGELYRNLPDGRWALFFDSHTIGSFSECQQKFAYSTLQRLRLKGPDRPCISIGSWWSKVSEKFYTEFAISGFVPVGRMAAIAIEAWVSENMDVMALTHPSKYEDFALPTDASMFASMLGLQGFDHAMHLAYQKKATKLREQAADLETVNDSTPTFPELEKTVVETQLSIAKLRSEADRLDKLTTLPLGPILMAVQYYEQYAHNDFRNWKVIGAENPFGGANEVLVGEDDKVIVYYQGRPDLVIYESATDQLMPLDQKTRDYIDKDVELRYKPHSQMSGYIYSTQKIARDLGFDRTVDRCLISVAARKIRKTAPKKGEKVKPRFYRVRPTFTVDEIAEWQRNTMLKANALREAIEHEQFVRQDGFMCHLFGGCDYRRLCNHPAGAREAIKKVDYVQVQAWSPLNEDEDD